MNDSKTEFPFSPNDVRLLSIIFICKIESLVILLVEEPRIDRSEDTGVPEDVLEMYWWWGTLIQTLMFRM